MDTTDLLEKHQVWISDSLTYLMHKIPFSSYSQIYVLCDTHTEKHCYALIQALLPEHKKIVVQPGEEYKNIQTCMLIWQALTDNNADRKALLINLGGGVLGDMGGFCAATYKRGIDFVQIPTTLLSMVDASVGGKLGIDFENFKNHIGVFAMPKRVLIFPGFLASLPYEEIRSGYAEVIKHALIRDAMAWSEITNTSIEHLLATPERWQTIIAHSIRIKANVVEADPTEKGLRKILNFGHTIGHAIETHYLHSNRLLHGEAIALGMVAEAYLSTKKGWLSEEVYLQIKRHLLTVYTLERFMVLKLSDFESILQYMYQDKKNAFGNILFSVLKSVGQCEYDVQYTREEIIESMKQLLV